MYDLIVLDAYQKDKVPSQPTTQKFMQLTSNRLDDDGVLFASVISVPDDPVPQFYRMEYKTIQSVHPRVHSFPTIKRVIVQNIEVVVTKGETLVTVEELWRRDRNRSIGIDLAAEFISYRNDKPTDDVPLLTDNRAPVDSPLDPMVDQRYVVQRTNETEQRTVDRNVTPRSTAADTAVRAA